MSRVPEKIFELDNKVFACQLQAQMFLALATEDRAHTREHISASNFFETRAKSMKHLRNQLWEKHLRKTRGKHGINKKEN